MSNNFRVKFCTFHFIIIVDSIIISSKSQRKLILDCYSIFLKMIDALFYDIINIHILLKILNIDLEAHINAFNAHAFVLSLKK